MGAIAEREFEGESDVCDFPVAFCDDFVLAKGCGASGAPGHDVCSFVYPALFVAFFEDCPDCVVVFVGEGEVAAA